MLREQTLAYSLLVNLVKTMSSRTSKSLISFGFGVIEKILILFLPFFVRTLLIYRLGIQYAGINGLFTSILTLLNVTDLGFSSAAMFCLFKPVADGDIDQINSINNFLRRVYFVVAIIILVVGSALTPFLPFFISGTYPNDINIYVIYLIYVLNSASSYLFFSYKIPVLETYHKNYAISIVRSLSEIIKSLLQTVILLIFPNYYLFILILPISTILMNFILQFYSMRSIPWVKPKGKLNSIIKLELKKKMVFLGINKVSSVLINSVDNIILSLFLGLAIVGIYGNYSLISSSLMGIVITMYSAIKPAVANQIIKENKHNSLITFSNLNTISFWICSWMAVTFFVLCQPFMEVWLGKKLLLGTASVALIVVFFFCNAMRHFFSHIYVDIFGIWNKTILVQLTCSLLNLVLDITLVKIWNINGIIIASVISAGLISFPYDTYLINKTMNDGTNTVTKTTFFNLCFFGITSILSIAVINQVNNYLQISGFELLVVLAIVCLIIPNLLFCSLFVIKNDFLYFLQNHLFKKRRKGCKK